MNIPTPRTDEWLAEEKRNPRVSGLGNWLDYCKTLERELTAAREESDKWEQLAHDKLSEVCRQIEKTRAVTEQRDRLAMALNNYRGQVDNEGNHSAPEALQSLNPTEP